MKGYKPLYKLLTWVLVLLVGLFTYGCSSSVEPIIVEPIEDVDIFQGVTDIDELFELITLELTYNAFLYHHLTDEEITQNSRVPSFVDGPGTTESMERILSILGEIDLSKLNPDQLLTYDVIKWYAQITVEGEDYLYRSNQLHFVSEPLQFLSKHKLTTKDQAQDYITKTSMLVDATNDILNYLKKMEEKGATPSSSFDLNYLRQLASRENNEIYRNFNNSIGNIPDLTSKEKNSLSKELEESIDNIFSIYEEIISTIANWEWGDASLGLAQRPGGSDYYAYLLRRMTTTNLTPEEIHEMGLREIERIYGEMRPLLDKIGYQDKSIADAMGEIALNGELNPSEIEREFQMAIDEMKTALPDLFNYIPANDVDVQVFTDDSFLFLFYTGFQDPEGRGTVHVNVSYPFSRHEIRSYAYHEAIPGHHLQYSINYHNEGKSRIRELITFPAYIEGWGLYAETLAYEQGFHNETESSLGYFNAELIRAARLVVDTGLHYKGWSREQAIQFMYETTGKMMGHEIDRYITMPGQACTYMIGQMEILRLREHFKQELGETFELKDFHSVILENGVLPLDALGNSVERYILQNK